MSNSRPTVLLLLFLNRIQLEDSLQTPTRHEERGTKTQKSKGVPRILKHAVASELKFVLKYEVDVKAKRSRCGG